MRFTSRASTSASIALSSGFSRAISDHVSSESSDSVAPAGLGYIAIILPSGELLKKKAMLMGIVKLSHCASVIRKLTSWRTFRGTRLNFAPALPLNSRAQASHAHSTCRPTGSSRCGCSWASSALHSSQCSTLRRGRANWRRTPNALSEARNSCAAIITLGMATRFRSPRGTNWHRTAVCPETQNRRSFHPNPR